MPGRASLFVLFLFVSTLVAAGCGAASGLGYV
jgi:hypothetical protein